MVLYTRPPIYKLRVIICLTFIHNCNMCTIVNNTTPTVSTIIIDQVPLIILYTPPILIFLNVFNHYALDPFRHM